MEAEKAFSLTQAILTSGSYHAIHGTMQDEIGTFLNSRDVIKKLVNNLLGD